LTESEIIDRIIAGETEAFAILVGQHQRRALSLAERMLQDVEEARDAVQDAFVKAYRSLAKFNRDASFSTWFYRIVYTTCLNVLERRKRLPKHDELDEESSQAWIEPSVFKSMEASMVDEVIADEMKTMNPMYSTVLELFYVDDRSYEEIVTITGMPLGTVKTRLNRGRNLLRKALLKRCPDLEVPS
jgi:RNA polymerase sigma-70 factor (ECF subfamily)